MLNNRKISQNKWNQSPPAKSNSREDPARGGYETGNKCNERLQKIGYRSTAMEINPWQIPLLAYIKLRGSWSNRCSSGLSATIENARRKEPRGNYQPSQEVDRLVGEGWFLECNFFLYMHVAGYPQRYFPWDASDWRLRCSYLPLIRTHPPVSIYPGCVRL